MPAPTTPNLRREIALLLAVKLVLIVAIKLAFFSHPARPGSEGTAQHLFLSLDDARGDALHE